MSNPEVSKRFQSATKLHTLSGLRLEHTTYAKPKSLLLVAYLCVEGRKDKRFLADLFWPKASNPLNSLAKALSELRQIGVLENDDTHVWATITSDANEFLEGLERRDLEQASLLYQDTFLSGIYLSDWGVELEEWVYSTREFLASRLREALLELAETSQDMNEAVRYAERAYELATPLEPEHVPRLYKFLSATAHADKLKREAKDYGLSLKPPKLVRANLPHRGTSFIGREIERLDLADLVSQNDAHLVSVIGPGGVGKTRLALEVAREMQESFSGGVAYLALEALTTPEQMLAGLASAFSVQLDQLGDIQQIAKVIADKHVLLLLDNFEHLVEETDSLCVLLQDCRNLKILVTSRVRLNLEEEWVYTLEGFVLPEQTINLAEAEHHDAIVLFVQRAKKVKPRFVLSDESLPFVLTICERVQGLPLGIELAASWVKVLPVQDIAEQLDDADFLTTSASNVSERHGSLRNVFEGSWQLLSNEEQTVLSKLSVFRGGFTREAAREVAGANLLVLARLVDKSFLRLWEGRYDQHLVLRTFAEEKLAARPDEQAATRARHAAYFLALADEAKPHLKTNQQKLWLLRLEGDLSNLRAAFVWFLGSEETTLAALQLVEALGVFFRSYGHTPQGRLWLHEALTASQDQAPSRERAEVLHSAAMLARTRGEYEKAHDYMRVSLELWQTFQDKEKVAILHGDFATLFMEQGDYSAAQQHSELALAHFRSVNNLTIIAVLSHNLGDLHRAQGQLEQARSLYQESLGVFRKVDIAQGVVANLTALAAVAYDQSDYQVAWQYCQESLSLLRKDVPKINILTETLVLTGKVAHALGRKEEAHAFVRESLELSKGIENALSMILGVESLALLHGQNDVALAVRLWATAETNRTTSRFVRTARDTTQFEDELRKARLVLGEERFATAWTLGQATALGQAVATALQQ